MKVAGLQTDIAWLDPDENFTRVRALAETAVTRGARLLVLPEMFATGFSMNVERLSGWADKIEAFLQALAYDLQVFVVGGLADAAPGRAEQAGRNWALAFNPDGGCVARYQKIHPFSYGEESRYYHGGQTLSGFEAEGVRVVPYICYDLRFPEVFRAAASHADLMLVIASWPAVRRHAWASLLVARAIENQCFVLGVNRVGEGGGLVYQGDSVLLDPLGLERSSPVSGPGLIDGEVTGAEVQAVRERFPFLADRQPALYARLLPSESVISEGKKERDTR